MTNQPDEYYINLILKGNVNSYTVLVERYKQMVFTLAVRMVKSKEGAEEISQDVFVKAYQNLSKFKGDSKFSTWIYKIAYYASLDAIKKNKRQILSDNIDTVKEVNLESTESVLQYLENKERTAIINKALFQLKEGERVLLTLFYFEEISIKEISKIMDLTDENVKVKLFRARKKLANVLKNVVEPNTINLV